MKRSRASWILVLSTAVSILISSFSVFASENDALSQERTLQHQTQKKSVSESNATIETSDDIAVVESIETRDEVDQSKVLNAFGTSALHTVWMKSFIVDSSFAAKSAEYIPLLLSFLVILTLSLPPPAFSRA